MRRPPFSSPAALLPVLLAALLALLAAAPAARATHFRYATYNWRQVGDADSLTYEFFTEKAWRCTFFTSRCRTVGGVIDVSGFSTRQAWQWNDGTPADPEKLTINVINVDNGQDYFIGTQTIRHTFTTRKVHTVTFRGCCRISELEDFNNDRNYKLEFQVDTRLGAPSKSVRSTSLPVIFFKRNTLTTFSMPIAASDSGLPLVFSLSSASKSGLFRTAPAGFTLTAAGIVSWNPSNAGLYAVQFTIDDGKNEIILDVLLEVADECTGATCASPPAFSPAVPVPKPFYLGTELSFDVVAIDPDAGQGVPFVTSSALPDSAILLPCKETTGEKCTRTFRWTPSLGQEDTFVCFTTSDAQGNNALGNYCVDLVRGVGQIIYASGIVRDFLSTHPDFARSGGDTSRAIVEDALGGDGKPVYAGGASTVSSASSFNEWWNTDDDEENARVFSVTLSNAGQADTRVFQYETSNLYPIDDEVLGNEGEAHNLYYTYEVHTYLTYDPAGGERYQFKAANDLWVFIDGRLAVDLGGLQTAERSQTVDFDTFAAANSLTPGETYRIDIFFAHRMAGATPSLTLQLNEATLCNALSSGTEVAGFGSGFSAADEPRLEMTGVSPAVVGGDLRLALATSATSAAVWLGEGGEARRQKFLNGFRSSFKFRITDGRPEGFAFVLQAFGPSARGGSGSNMGYAGLTNSLAVEFDTAADPDQFSANGDPAYQHISVQSRFTAANSASQDASLGVTEEAEAFNFINGTEYEVAIEYTPALDDNAGGPLLGWLRVFYQGRVVPVLQVQVDGAELKTMFSGSAGYVGFTAANSEVRGGTVDITEWSFTVVPATAQQSAADRLPLNVQAGQEGSAVIQLKDACANLVRVGGDSGSLGVVLARLSDTATGPAPSEAELAVTVADNDDGTYELSYRPTTAGAYALSITYAGSRLGSSPYQFAVNSDVTSAAESDAVYGALPEGYDNTGEAAAPGMYAAVFDADGEVAVAAATYETITTAGQTALAGVVLALTDGQVLVLAARGSAFADSGSDNPARAALSDAGSTLIGSLGPGMGYALALEVNGGGNTVVEQSRAAVAAERAEATLQVGGTGADGFRALARSSGETSGNAAYVQRVRNVARAVVDTEVEFTISARDQYGNAQTGFGDVFTVDFFPSLADGNGRVVSTTQLSEGRQAVRWTTEKSGEYSMLTQFGGLGLSNSPHTVSVRAGPAVAASTVLFGAGLFTATAGDPSEFRVTLKDSFGNEVNGGAGATDTVEATLTPAEGGAADVTATGVWDADAFSVSYTAQQAGTYTLEVRVNGVVFSGHSFSPFVEAGEVSAADCALELPDSLSVVAGEAATFTVVARDRFENPTGRAVPAGGPQFVVGVSPDAAGGSTAAVTHLGAGRYEALFTPTASGTTVASPSLGGTAFGGGAASFSVTAAALAAASTVSGVAGGEAGPQTFVITATDRFGNVRAGFADENSFDVVARSAGGGVYVATSDGIAASGTGVYTATWTARMAATYEVYASLLGGAALVDGDGGLTAAIVAGPASAANCLVDLSSGVGGVEGTNVTLVITSRDQYDNVRLASTADAFSATATPPGSLTTTPGQQGDGVYQLTYEVPTFSAGSPSYALTVFLTPAGGAAEIVFEEPNAPVSQSGSESKATAAGAGLTDSVAGVEATFTITDKDAGGTPIIGGAKVFQAFFTGPGAVTRVTVSAQPAGGATYVVEYTPVVAGNYDITVKEGGVETDESAAGYTMTCVAGDVEPSSSAVEGFPASIAAGSNGTATVTLRDSEGNEVDDDSLAVTLTPVTGTQPDLVVYEPEYLGGGRFHLTYTATGASTAARSLFVRVGGVSIGAVRSMLVVPAEASAADSSVIDDSTALSPAVTGPTVAGETTQVAAQMTDVHGNDLVSDTVTLADFGLEALVSPGGAAAGSSLNRAYYAGSGRYALIFSATSTGTLSLAVLLGGVKVGGASFDADFTPAAPSESLTTIEGGAASTFVAGGSASYVVAVQDVFGNQWRSGAGLLAAPTLGPSGGSTASEVASLGGGRYRVTLADGAAVDAGNYTSQLVADARRLDGLEPVVVIDPADPSANQTVIDVPSAVVAGETAYATVRMRDAYRNGVTGTHALAVSMLGDEPRCEIDPDGTEGRQVPTDAFTTSADALGDGLFNVSYSSQETGSYTLSVLVAGETIPCELWRAVKVTPAAASAALSVAEAAEGSTALSAAVAGAVQQFTVSVRDVYGNDVERGTDSVTVGVPDSEGDSVDGWIADGQPGVSASVRNNNDGTFLVQYSATAAGEYQLVVRVNGARMQLPSASVSVTAAAISTFVAVGDVANAVAGRQSSFTLLGADQYGNNVTGGNNRFSVFFSNLVIDYTFEVVSDDGLVVFTPAWHGAYQAQVQLVSSDPSEFGPDGPPTVTLAINVAHATCAFAEPDKPYRCPDTRECVAAYSECGGIAFSCDDPALPVQCAGDTCAATSAGCPCPDGGDVRCPYSGLCVSDAASMCLRPSPCPASHPVRCESSGACRASASECPAQPVCPPGYAVCSDGVSCQGFGLTCPAVNGSAACATGSRRCANGRCVRSFEDCPAPPTCPAGRGVVCPDGSCQNSSSACPSPYECDSEARPMRCADGSCASSPEQCPSAAVCPAGSVVCPSSAACAASLAACGPVLDCPLNRTRCPDGSCQENLLHCASRVTCPAARPVRCSDGECVGSEFECAAPSACGAELLTCPDGSCVSAAEFCPTQRSCPADAPVLCGNGDCQADVAACGTRPRCPEEAPVRCPDGACRGATLDCPSHTACPGALPVRCLDDKCVAAPELCRPIEELRCADGAVRCPGGECAASQLVCPTTVTCAPGFRRCADGTCRAMCAATSKQCEPDEVACPQSGHGVACASDINECPLGQVCPVTRPVRCIDASCASSVLACPPTPDSYETPKVPCSDGSFEADPQKCGTPVTCPPAVAPYKCFDDTCRVAPADCPEPPQCPADAPYLCHDGNCEARLWNCRAFGGEPCTDESPVRCPDGSCVAAAASCPSPFPTSAEDFSCPHGWFRCRDGSCREKSTLCESLVCPPELPHLCDSGLCARAASGCDLENGCQAELPARCWNGACAPSEADCPSPEGNCTDDQLVRCPDGSCAPGANICPAESGCPLNFVRCLDGRCESKPRDITTFNPCTSGRSDGNACPGSKPFRCPRGFCAVSSLLCPEQLPDALCPADRPVACDSGLCRESSAQCAVVVPCGGELGSERCGDGTCREEGACPEVSLCPDGYSRCPNGVCGRDGEPCYNDLTGCPQDRVLCEDSRACVSTPSECAQQDGGGNRLTANGCPEAAPEKCFNGECVSDLGLCLAGNGCPLAEAFVCGDGVCEADPDACDGSGDDCADGAVRCADGLCKASPGLCATTSGCPALTPVRCVDGSCARFAASALPGAGGAEGESCPRAVACGAAEVRCADGSCAASSTLCPSHEPCPASAPLSCSDGSCAVSQVACPELTACPALSPVVCPNGGCRASLAACEATTSAAREGSACADGLALCFDGSCRASARACVKWAFEVRRNASLTDAAFDGISADGLCPNDGETACGDGSCVPFRFMCGVQAGCPDSEPVRCGDGSCASSCDGVTMPSCPAGNSRCVDGTCRSSCLPYDGCPLSAPYHCPDRTCAARLSGCGADAKEATAAAAASRRLLADGDTLWCVDGCNRDVKARLAAYAVQLGEAASLPVGFSDELASVGTLLVPSGGIRRAGNGSDVTLQVRPVADSQMRGATNPVPRSRQIELGATLGYLSTVVSAAFECVAGADVVQPFPIPLAYTAAVDDGVLQRARPEGYDERDVCLARLRSAGGQWECLVSDADARDAGPERVEGAAEGEFTGTLDTCQEGVAYAFVVAPNRVVLPPSQSGGGLDWWVWLTIIVSLGVVVLLATFVFTRLYRYRRKLHEKRAEVDELNEVVHDMEMYGSAATRDQDVAMIQNPLALNMKEMTGRQGMQEAATGGEGAVYEDEGAAERQERLRTLNDDRRRLQQDLDKMKAELETRGQGAPVVDDMSGQHAGGVSSVAAAARPPPLPPASRSAGGDEGFGAPVRPKKRNL